MKKKLLSLALALVMCLGLTVPAFAAENPEDWWKNAKEVKNYDEFVAALEDEKVEEIKIVGEVTIPQRDEALHADKPVLVGKEGSLKLDKGAMMYSGVPMGRFNFEDAEHTWDLVAGMCETFLMWNDEPGVYNRDIFGAQPDDVVSYIAGVIKDEKVPLATAVFSGADVTLTDDLSMAGTLQVHGHNLTIGKGVKVETGSLYVDGDLIMEEGASLTLTGEGSSITGKATFADEKQKPENLEIPEAAEPEAPAEAEKPAETPAAPKFTDVAATSPFAAAIDWAVAEGITLGTTETTFGPSNTCSISNILTFLWRANGKPGAAEGVADRDAAAKWGVEKRMIAEDQDTSAPCTRIMAVCFMWIAAGEPETEAETAFTDLIAGADYLPAVAWAVENGVTKGTSETTFSPDNTCTRGQIVTFLYRANQAAQ